MTEVLTSPLNVADRLDEVARLMPQATAIAEPTRRVVNGRRVYRTVSFRELADDVERIARGLFTLGVRPGTRLALLVPPSVDFITLVFALLKSGAVQILIDPGMGKRNLVRCLADAEPEGFVAVPIVQALRVLLRRRFPRARFNVNLGRRAWRGAITLEGVRDSNQRDLAMVSSLGLPAGAKDRGAGAITNADDPAAIIFTSGSTGPPKGVLYRHGNFDRQVTEIRDAYAIEPGEIDVPCFPLFGLFNAAMGVTTVIPRMDFSRPATVDPRNIVEAVEQWRATQSFASPAVWNRVGPYCEAQGIRLGSLRRVMSAGAPVPARVLASMKVVIHPHGDVHTPYGATEALPVATIAASEVIKNTWPLTEQGRGVCVGGRFPGIEWRVIRAVDGPIPTFDDAEELSAGQIGELIVRGPVVTTEYCTRQEANTLAKIHDRGSFNGAGPNPLHAADATRDWHRMGDCGYLDGEDRFWFCGRLSQRVVTPNRVLYTIPTEARFNLLTGVARSALVGIGRRGSQQPAIVIQPSDKRNARRRLMTDTQDTLITAMRETNVRHLLVYPRSLPVDVRHNAKIAREQLAEWSQRHLSGRRAARCVLLKDVS